MDLEPFRMWNPHWGGAGVTPRVLKDGRERTVVPYWIAELLAPPSGMWALKAGPRQIGKTTSLGHVARRLMEEHGVAPQRITIAPLDDEAIRVATHDSLEHVIQTAFSRHAPTAREPVFLLLDEVQAFPDWAAQLKSAWDRHHDRLRVLATGSSALKILRPANADFPGRIRMVTVHPMKFREVAETHPALTDAIDPTSFAEVVELAKRCRVGLTQDPAGLADAFERLHTSILAHDLDRILAHLWLEHCTWGGHPAVRPGSETEPAERLDRFEGGFNTILTKDVVLGGVRKLREFRLLFRHIALHPGGIFEPYSVGNRLDIEGSIVKEWKRILEDVMLVQQLEPLKRDLSPDVGRDKAYPTDPGWIGYFRGEVRHRIDPDDPQIGALVETVLVDHVRRLRFNVQGTTALPIGYVKRPEVDIAADLGKRWLLVEAKYSSRPRVHIADVGPADAVRIVATRDRFETGDASVPHFIPAHEFALMC